MGIKDFITKKAVEKQMGNLPKEQQEMMIALVQENPDFFKMLNDEISAKKKSGMDEQMAAMQVMRAHQGEMQKLMMKYAKK